MSVATIPQPGRKRKRRIFAGAIAACCVVGLVVSREAWLPAVGHWLNVGEPPRSCDYAILLAGDVQARPFAAALLYKHGYAKKLVVTRPRVHPHTLIAGYEYTEFVRRVFRHYEIPDEAVEILPTADVASTFDEAQAAAPLVRANPSATFAVVTSDYHTRRSLWIFRQAVPEAAGRMTAVAVPTDDYSSGDWWQTEYGLSTYLREYLRLAFYYLRYGRAVQATLLSIVGVAAALWFVRRRRPRRIVPA